MKGEVKMKNWRVTVTTDIVAMGFMVQATNHDKAAAEAVGQAIMMCGVDVDEINSIKVEPW